MTVLHHHVQRRPRRAPNHRHHWQHVSQRHLRRRPRLAGARHAHATPAPRRTRVVSEHGHERRADEREVRAKRLPEYEIAARDDLHLVGSPRSLNDNRAVVNEVEEEVAP